MNTEKSSMGYNSNNKLITAPIGIGDIAEALGEFTLDVGTLCASARVNKWAKYKPIVYPTWNMLNESQRRGTAEDNRNNIFYGIKISGLPTSPILNDSIAFMHDATFEHVRPYGGAAAPYRMTDFDRYKHDAEPNPFASFNTDEVVAFYNDSSFEKGGLADLIVRYDVNNIYGVDMLSIMSDPSVDVQDTLSRSYPCILVTDANGYTYFTALYTTLPNGTYGPRPLLYNGQYSSEPWFVKFSKPKYSESGVSGSNAAPPWTSVQSGMRATLFLLRSASPLVPQITLGGINFGDYWVETAEQAATERPMVLPGAVGVPMRLEQYFSGVVFQPVGITASVLGNNPAFSVSLDETTGMTSANTITIQVSITLDGMGTYSKNITVNKWPSTMPAVLITASDIAHIAGTIYTGKVSVVTKDGQATNQTTMNFSLTL